MSELNPLTANDFVAALDWWRAAGVDMDFSDDVTAWLTESRSQTSEQQASGPAVGPAVLEKAPNDGEKKPAESRQKETLAEVDLFGENPPKDLAEFHRWWLEAPGLDAIGPRGRVPPRGSKNAKLMIVVVDPEQQDRDQLLSGPRGRLLEKIRVAMQLGENDLYLASALPRHTPMADTVNLANAGMHKVLLHHIALAQPENVLAFGHGILPLLGHALTQDPVSLREINQNNAITPLLVSEGLDDMMNSPRLKARFWRRWTKWSEDT